MSGAMIEVFKGLLYTIVQGPQTQDGSSGTKRYPTTPPTVRVAPEKLGEKATARITKSAMALEIETFIRETSKGKMGFKRSLTVLREENQMFTVIVDCSWDEPEPELPVAASAMPSQASGALRERPFMQV